MKARFYLNLTWWEGDEIPESLVWPNLKAAKNCFAYRKTCNFVERHELWRYDAGQMELMKEWKREDGR